MNQKVWTLAGKKHLVIFVVMMLAVVLLRVHALDADPPLHISNSQGAATDASNTVGPARDKIYFDDWTTSYSTENMYNDYPLVIWLGYTFFRLLGTGYWQASLMTVMLSLIGMAFVYAFARENFNSRVALLTVVLLAFNYVYIVYNRMSVVYTPLNVLVAISLYFWGRGLKRPFWFLVSIFVAVCNVLLVKVAGLAFLVAVVVGAAIRIRRDSQKKSLLLAVLTVVTISLVLGLLAVLIIPSPRTALLRYLNILSKRTFDPSAGLWDNVRFFQWSLLYFGIRTIFFIRMPVLLILAYCYIWWRTASVLLPKASPLPMPEVILMLYWYGTVAMLLITNGLSTRYMILLAPPMALAASILVDSLLKRAFIRLPQLPEINFRFLFFSYLSISYLAYLVLAIAYQFGLAQYFGVGLGDSQAIVPPTVILTLLIVALLIGLAGTFVFLIIISRGPAHFNFSSQLRHKIALGLIVAVVLIGLGQYLAWTNDLSFTIVRASRQFAEDFDTENIVVGGPYAYVLTAENDASAHIFFPHNTRPKAIEDIRTAAITHLAVETAWNVNYMWQNYPDIMERATLVKEYPVRGYQVQVYEIAPSIAK